jgi:hypothetical protein
MPLAGIRTHDPSKRSAADLRLRPHGHWDRRKYVKTKKITTEKSFMESDWDLNLLCHKIHVNKIF